MPHVEIMPPLESARALARLTFWCAQYLWDPAITAYSPKQVGSFLGSRQERGCLSPTPGETNEQLQNVLPDQLLHWQRTLSTETPACLQTPEFTQEPNAFAYRQQK